jgi:RHS repeat-associated protein
MSFARRFLYPFAFAFLLLASHAYASVINGSDTLAWETTNEESTHYFYEPDSFVPLAQGVQNHAIQLHPTPDWTDRDYSLREGPLWTQVLEPEPFDKLGFYHCDHLGTPQEMSDEEGNIAWQAQYKAWGEAKEIISKAAQSAGFRNPLRFQGQYFDHETGRFISKDPIRYAGGMNLHVYAPNPIEWVDPLGLQIIRDCKTKQCRDTATGRFVKCTAPQQQAPDFIVFPPAEQLSPFLKGLQGQLR